MRIKTLAPCGREFIKILEYANNLPHIPTIFHSHKFSTREKVDFMLFYCVLFPACWENGYF